MVTSTYSEYSTRWEEWGQGTGTQTYSDGWVDGRCAVKVCRDDSCSDEYIAGYIAGRELRKLHLYCKNTGELYETYAKGLGICHGILRKELHPGYVRKDGWPPGPSDEEHARGYQIGRAMPKLLIPEGYT